MAKKMDLTKKKIAKGVACIACSTDHFMTASAAIDEASRMAQGGKDINNDEIIKRLGLAKRELDVMERIDLTDKKISNMKGDEKNLALDVKKKSAELRHGIMGVKSQSDLMDLSSIATKAWEDVWARSWKMAKGSIKCPVKKHPAKPKVERGKLNKNDAGMILTTSVSYAKHYIKNTNLATLEHCYKKEKKAKKPFSPRKSLLGNIQSQMNKMAGCKQGTKWNIKKRSCIKG